MITSSAEDALRKVPMFAELRAGDVERIAPLLHRRRYPKKALILLQGDEAPGLYLIAAGRVKLVVSGEDGKDVVLSTRVTGDFFGELSLFDSRPLGMSVAVMEDVEVLLLSKEDFHRKLNELPGISIGLLRVLCNRLHQANMRISAATLLDVPQRVAHVLLELADENDGIMIPQPLTHQFISECVGASRESVSRTMSHLTRSGLIATAQETVSISDRRHGRRPVHASSAGVAIKRKAIRIVDRQGLERAACQTV